MPTFDSKLIEELSREQASLLGILPTEPDDRLASFARLSVGGYYKNCPVTRFARLLDTSGQSLRASAIDIFADDIYWWYGYSAANLVTHANGYNSPSDASWQFSGLKQFQIVLYQPGGSAFGIESETSAASQRLNLNPNLDCLIGVNDVVNTYFDNSGAFSIYVRVVA